MNGTQFLDELEALHESLRPVVYYIASQYVEQGTGYKIAGDGDRPDVYVFRSDEIEAVIRDNPSERFVEFDCTISPLGMPPNIKWEHEETLLNFNEWEKRS